MGNGGRQGHGRRHQMEGVSSRALVGWVCGKFQHRARACQQSSVIQVARCGSCIVPVEFVLCAIGQAVVHGSA